jgi:hypothetical protein
MYDYAVGNYIPISPITGVVSITFENTVTSAIDYGQTSITNFGGVNGTSWVSPITYLVGTDPYGGGITNTDISYTFPNVSDYPTTFLEEAASQANVYSLSNDNTKFWAYHIEIRARRDTPSRGGTGDADYFFTPESLLSFYNDFNTSGAEANFNESYQLYDDTTGKSFGGYSWSGTATIASVVENAPVPIPTSILLFGSGIASMLGTKLKRKKK